MKVEELIKKLQNFDPQKEVVVLHYGDNPIDDDGANIKDAFEIKGLDDYNYVYIMED